MTPHPNELDALIRAARDVSGPPPDVASRLIGRLDAVAAAPGAGAVAFSKTALFAGGGLLFVVGALAGGGVVWATRPAVPVVPPIVAVVERPAALAIPAPVEPAPAAPAVEDLPVPPPPKPTARKSPAPPPASTLEEERRLLDGARAHVVAGAWAEALTAVAEHEARFPNGALAEEREALAIQALGTTDRRAAVGRAAAFRKRWPTSILEPVIENVVPRDGNSVTPQ